MHCSSWAFNLHTAAVQKRVTERAQEGAVAATSQMSVGMTTVMINSMAHVRKPSTGTIPKSFDTVIPNLETRAHEEAPPVVELKNLVQDRLKLCALDYDEMEERKTQKKQSMYRCTVKHPLIPCSQVQGNWCNSKRHAKQDAANKALELIYKQYGRT